MKKLDVVVNFVDVVEESEIESLPVDELTDEFVEVCFARSRSEPNKGQLQGAYVCLVWVNMSMRWENKRNIIYYQTFVLRFIVLKDFLLIMKLFLPRHIIIYRNRWKAIRSPTTAYLNEDRNWQWNLKKVKTPQNRDDKLRE